MNATPTKLRKLRPRARVKVRKARKATVAAKKKLLRPQAVERTPATFDKYVSLLVSARPHVIRSEQDCAKMRKHLRRIMTPNPPRAEAMLIDLLATLIENYESREHPTPKLPPEVFLAETMAARELTIAKVVEGTGIPQSTLSNVLAGRRGISKVNAMKLSEFLRLPVSAFL